MVTGRSASGVSSLNTQISEHRAAAADLLNNAQAMSAKARATFIRKQAHTMREEIEGSYKLVMRRMHNFLANPDPAEIEHNFQLLSIMRVYVECMTPILAQMFTALFAHQDAVKAKLAQQQAEG